MSEQIRISEKAELLNSDGTFTNPGYCFTNMYEYNRNKIKTLPWRTKEWDFYQISNSRYCVQITISDISIAGVTAVTIFDMETGIKTQATSIKPASFGSENLNQEDIIPSKYHKKLKNFDLSVDTKEEGRHIVFIGKAGKKNISADFYMEHLENHESHIVAIPFDTKDKKHFYLNKKMNCMVTTGTVHIDNETIEFKGREDNSFCVLDWGRGVWPYHEKWWWGNGSMFLDNGDIFGFELGWGFGNTDKVSESTLFLNGKAYKIGYVSLENENEIVGNWTSKDWKFVSDDGSVNLTMTPEYDNYSNLRILFIGNKCHQVFGTWNGTVVIDGKTIEIKNMKAFCENSDNMW